METLWISRHSCLGPAGVFCLIKKTYCFDFWKVPSWSTPLTSAKHSCGSFMKAVMTDCKKVGLCSFLYPGIVCCMKEKWLQQIFGSPKWWKFNSSEIKIQCNGSNYLQYLVLMTTFFPSTSFCGRYPPKIMEATFWTDIWTLHVPHYCQDVLCHYHQNHHPWALEHPSYTINKGCLTRDCSVRSR